MNYSVDRNGMVLQSLLQRAKWFQIKVAYPHGIVNRIIEAAGRICSRSKMIPTCTPKFANRMNYSEKRTKPIYQEHKDNVVDRNGMVLQSLLQRAKWFQIKVAYPQK
jgi:hypothetical protein